MKKCTKCNIDFEITRQDEAFYDKIKVPKPTLCPQCRNQRRMSFRNERHLYQRECDLCAKTFLSIYEANRKFPVYCYDCWWGDTWDAFQFGQDYHNSRSFFEQLNELFNKVPHLGIVTAYCENSDYANYTNYSKNCYLVFGCHAAEDCYYGWRMHDGLQCVDCLQIDKSKYCYDCVDCDECYSLFFSQDCSHCNDSAFLYDCKSCQDCLFSAGLRNKRYCILNKPYAPSEYAELKKQIIDDMTSRKEYGEFFPPELSPFSYNETVANDYYPLKKEETLVKGFTWKEGDPKDYQMQMYGVPDHVRDVPDTITKEVLACERCHKNYKIVVQELRFYKNFNVPIPRHCFHCRHQARMKQRNPRQLWVRECTKCHNQIQTPYSQEHPEKVICEKCYLQEIY